MKNRFFLALGVCAPLLAALAVGSFFCLLRGGVNVILSNVSGGDITNIQLKFTGGSRTVPKLKSEGTFQSKINPDSESDLVVEFTDSSGKQHSTKVDVYFEPDCRGTIRVTIQPEGKVTWKDETKSKLY